MNSYIIKAINENVSVSQIIDKSLKPIKIDGDFTFPLVGFWDSFKRKIEYEDNEKLCFIVLTDDKHFKLDANIAIAEQFNVSDDELQSLLSELDIDENLHLSCHPKVTFDLKKSLSSRKINKPQEQQAITDTKPELIKPNSVQSYYRKKTNAIKTEKKVRR
jgi:hypothetical protein